MKVTKLTKEQWLKVAKTLAYVAVSAVIGSLLAQLQERPDLFGLYTPIVNIVLVTIRQALAEDKE